MTRARSLLTAMAAVAVLIGARPIAGDEQFPRGLLAGAAPTAGRSRSCTIETRSLSFGNYDPLETRDVYAIGQIIYTCSGGGGGGGRGGGGGPGGGPPPGRGGGPGAGTTSSGGQNGIRIEMAQGSSNSFAPRGMVGPEFLISSRRLDYNIYLDSTHRQVWGTGEGPTQAYVDSNPPNGTPVIVPAFGRIFGNQDVVSGPYTDTVPVRILF
jgi:spore coat protein U-like protein